MQNLYRTDGWVKSTLGPAIPGAQIWLCSQPANIASAPPSPLAPVFSDPGGLFPITFPVLTDGFGHYDFYTLPGLYTLVVAYGGQIQQVYPDQSIGGVGTGSASGTALILQTNGMSNGNQLSLNLQGAGSVSVADNGSGTTTITGTVFTGPSFQTNGVPNTLQSVLNLKVGANITLTPDALGGVSIAATAQAGSYPSGANVCTLPAYAHSTAGLNGYTIVLRIPASYVQAFTSGLKIGLVTTATTGLVVNAASIGKTLPGSTVWVGSPVAFTWPAGAFAVANSLYLSNTCAIAGDANHDYYIMVYFDPSSSGGSAYASEVSAPVGSTLTAAAFLYSAGLSGWIVGNHTADGNASSIQSLTGSSVFCIQQVLTA